MDFTRCIFTVDSHTLGQPTRIVVGGLPFIPGKNAVEKKEYLMNKMDFIRTALMLEPRGHRDMFGAVIVPPSDPAADMGIVFMDTGGYLNMCGHGTIGAVTVAIETGLIPAREPVTGVVLDTPAGLVKAKARAVGNKVLDVTFENVPAFLWKADHRIVVDEIGEVSVSIAFGGSFFGLVSAKDLKVELEMQNIPALILLGMKLNDALRNIKVEHPEKKYINSIDLIEIYDSSPHAGVDMKNCVIFGKGQVDRSPCGTGTCAKLAELYFKQKIGINEQITNESILGTVFRGRIVQVTKVGEFQAIIPEITGSAYITGIHQFIINNEDPLKDGFLLG